MGEILRQIVGIALGVGFRSIQTVKPVADAGDGAFDFRKARKVMTCVAVETFTSSTPAERTAFSILAAQEGQSMPVTR